MAGDWVRLYRAMLDHPVMRDDFLCRLWMWCLLKANYKPARWRDQVIEPGSFVTGRIVASHELKVSPSRWYRGISRLQDIGCVSAKPNSNWTVITVCNWKTYQQEDNDDRTTQRTANEQRANTSKEGKKESPIGDSNPPTPRTISLPANLSTPDFKATWGDWIQHRKEIKKPLTPTNAAALIKKFSRWGPERAIAAMTHTIEMGWQGLKEPDDDNETRRTNGTRGSGSAGGDRFDRAQARETKQLGTLEDWAASREAAESLHAGGLCEGNGTPDGDETHRRIDAASA